MGCTLWPTLSLLFDHDGDVAGPTQYGAGSAPSTGAATLDGYCLVGVGGLYPQVRQGKLVVVLSIGRGRLDDFGDDASAGHRQVSGA